MGWVLGCWYLNYMQYLRTHIVLCAYSLDTHTRTHTLAQTNDEELVAIKTCKPDASNEDRAKFLEEAGECWPTKPCLLYIPFHYSIE